jgi:predicted deacetylase
VNARLVVSLSGINARTVEQCAELSDELARRQVPLSLLFAPRVSGSDTAAAWVRRRHAAGDALLLHGFDHAAEPRNRGIALGRRAEFAALPAHEANLRLIAASAALERVGLTAGSFAPPRWLVSRGTLTALRHRGFLLCADLGGVRDLRTGIVHKGRIQGFGSGERAETWWCYAVVLGAGRAARRGGLVRIAADATDLTRTGPRQALLDAVDIALHHGASPMTYPDVLTDPLARAA